MRRRRKLETVTKDALKGRISSEQFSHMWFSTSSRSFHTAEFSSLNYSVAFKNSTEIASRNSHGEEEDRIWTGRWEGGRCDNINQVINSVGGGMGVICLTNRLVWSKTRRERGEREREREWGFINLVNLFESHVPNTSNPQPPPPHGHPTARKTSLASVPAPPSAEHLFRTHLVRVAKWHHHSI